VKIPLSTTDNGPIDAAAWTALYREFNRKMSLAHNGKSFLLWGLSGLPIGRPIGLRGNQYEPSYLVRLGIDCENNTFFIGSPIVGQWPIYDHQIYADTAAALEEGASDVENGIIRMSDVAGYQYSTLLNSLEAHQRNGLYMADSLGTGPQRFESIEPVELVVDGADTFDIPRNWDKYACWRVHNMQPRFATVTFAGGYTLELNPWDCKTVRRLSPTGPYLGWQRYFWPYQKDDARWLLFTGTGGGVPEIGRQYATANNIGNPAILLEWIIAMNAEIDPTEPGQPPSAVLDKFCRLTDPDARIGDMLYHKGEFWSVKYKDSKLIEKKRASFTGIANLGSDLSKISAGFVETANGLELVPDSNVDSHDVVGTETNFLPTFPTQPSGYIPCSVVIPKVLFSFWFNDVNTPITTPLNQIPQLYAGALSNLTGFTPSQTALRWSPIGPLVISRLSIAADNLNVPPRYTFRRVYYDIEQNGIATGSEYSRVFSQQLPETWPDGAQFALQVSHSCLQNRSYGPYGQDTIGENGVPGGKDVQLGPLPTVDIEIKRHGLVYTTGYLLAGGNYGKLSAPELDNLRNILRNGLEGTAMTFANRAAFLGATTPAAAEGNFVQHRVQFNDYNLLAWTVNAWRRHRPMATYDLAPFLLSAPGGLFGYPEPGFRKVPVKLGSLNLFDGGSAFGSNVYESATSFQFTRSLLSPANDDGDDLETKGVAWYAAQKFGWAEKENSAFTFVPHRTGQTYQRFYIDLADVRDWAISQGLQHSIFRGGHPWTPTYTATNDVFPSPPPPPDQFDTLTFSATGTQNASSNAMLLGSGFFPEFMIDPPTIRRFTWEVRLGIVQNTALVSTGQTQMLEPGTVTTENLDFEIHNSQYINLDATA
jgi:hypothetical protein